MKLSMATGRRKNAIAQVRMLPGTGKIIVNKKQFNVYFPVDFNQMEALRALDVTKSNGKFDIFISVCGGGVNGQAGAVQLAIARALLAFDETVKSDLRKFGLLTRDPRMVERKKYGRKKARKRFQFSKR